MIYVVIICKKIKIANMSIHIEFIIIEYHEIHEIRKTSNLQLLNHN